MAGNCIDNAALPSVLKAWPKKKIFWCFNGLGNSYTGFFCIFASLCPGTVNSGNSCPNCNFIFKSRCNHFYLNIDSILSFFLLVIPHQEIWNNPSVTAFYSRLFSGFLGDLDALLDDISSPSSCLFCLTYILFKL